MVAESAPVGFAPAYWRRRPASGRRVDEVKNLSWDELNLVIAMNYATEIRAVVDKGGDALRLAVKKWEPESRAALAPGHQLRCLPCGGVAVGMLGGDGSLVAESSKRRKWRWQPQSSESATSVERWRGS